MAASMNRLVYTWTDEQNMICNMKAYSASSEERERENFEPGNRETYPLHAALMHWQKSRRISHRIFAPVTMEIPTVSADSAHTCTIS